MSKPLFNIATVERDTGLSKDVLRVWERRYGFPSPERDAHGERLYAADQVERLRTIKRLMDLGHRPGKLIVAPPDELEALSRLRRAAPEPMSSVPDPLSDLLDLIRQHDAPAFTQAMQQRLARQGLLHFVQDTVAPLTHSVGLAWEEGRIEVFEEHLFTELTKRLLRQAIAAVPPGPSPTVLLTSPPEEQHALGLLMVEALLALDGARSVPLGTQMPLVEMVHAAQAHRADIVALSFSAAFPARQVSGLLQQLRAALPAPVALWAGGSGVRRVSPQAGVQLLPSLEAVTTALAAWRGDALPA